MVRHEYFHARELNQDMGSEMASLVAENQRLTALLRIEKVVDFLSKEPKNFMQKGNQ